MVEELITLIANAAKARSETLDGEEYLVAPVVMIKKGVHEGNEGPVFYGETVLADSAPLWDKQPLTVYHPKLNDVFVSAHEPVVAAKRTIGFLSNSAYANGELTSEAWVNVKKADAVDPRIVKALKAGTATEVSTGMFAATEDEVGVFNQKTYKKAAKSIKPDHLAVLPDQKGACDIKCGCGMLRNSAEGVPINNEASFDRIRSGLSQAVYNQFSDAYVRDVYASFFVYRSGEKLYKQTYEVDKDGAVKLGGGKPVEVKWVQEYRTADGGKFIGNCSSLETENMDKNQKITLLINAKVGWEEADRERLARMDDATLEKQLKAASPPAPPPPPAPAPVIANQQAAPAVTTEQFIANAPPEIRAVLESGLAAHRNVRETLIANIKANPNNRFTDQWLAGQDNAVLEGLASFTVTRSAAPVSTSVPILNAAQGAGAPPVLTPPNVFTPEKK